MKTANTIFENHHVNALLSFHTENSLYQKSLFRAISSKKESEGRFYLAVIDYIILLSLFACYTALSRNSFLILQHTFFWYNYNYEITAHNTMLYSAERLISYAPPRDQKK